MDNHRDTCGRFLMKLFFSLLTLMGVLSFLFVMVLFLPLFKNDREDI